VHGVMQGNSVAIVFDGDVCSDVTHSNTTDTTTTGQPFNGQPVVVFVCRLRLGVRLLAQFTSAHRRQ
jgi:hypothetical protein